MLNLQKDKLSKQKLLYFILIIIILLGIGTGFFYIFLLKKEIKTELLVGIDQFFATIKTANLDKTATLINSLSANGLSLLLIWILGVSIIGIPFILMFLFYKSFILSFSFISIITKYHLKGIFLALTYIFPSQILNLVIWLLLSFYAISFSIKLMKVLFLKKNLNLREPFKKYTKILGICIVVLILSSVFESYLSPYLMNFFLK